MAVEAPELSGSLTIQPGEEDGHQGGSRYKSDDPSYLVIRDGVLKQAGLQRGD